ncbi:MAG: hypothetical protein ACRBDI_10680 [Alphaproteobacteria bacterium]
MSEFNPKEDVKNSELVLVDGDWPSFHDAQVHHYSYWKGDLRPDDDVWVGSQIIIDFELCALEEPFYVKLKFSDCGEVNMSANNPDNSMYDLNMSYEKRGFFTSGKPLPPYIAVELKESFGFHLKFKCMSIDVVERYKNVRIFD